MRVFGEVIAEARRKANLTQRQLAALIKNEEGRGISGPYLNDIEPQPAASTARLSPAAISEDARDVAFRGDATFAKPELTRR